MLVKKEQERVSRVEQKYLGFPSWFMAISDSLPLLVLFGLGVLVCAPLLMVYGAIYPLFRQ